MIAKQENTKDTEELIETDFLDKGVYCEIRPPRARIFHQAELFERKPAFNNPVFNVGKQTTLCGLKPKEEQPDEETGDLVLAVGLTDFLMLDIDNRAEHFVLEYSDKCARFHHLGSHLVERSSTGVQKDLDGNLLNHYYAIFGKRLPWEVVLELVREAERLHVVSHDFSYLRKFGSITLRTSAKNEKKPAPVTVKLVRNGSMQGIREYLMHKMTTEGLGKLGKN